MTDTSRISEVIKQYVAKDGLNEEFAVRQLLTELRFYCIEHSIDFNDENKGSETQYQDELDMISPDGMVDPDEPFLGEE